MFPPVILQNITNLLVKSFIGVESPSVTLTIGGAVFGTRLPHPQVDFYFERRLSSSPGRFLTSLCRSRFDGMWKVAMSEEVGKALQSVVDRVNQAAARRPKVTASPGDSSAERR